MNSATKINSKKNIFRGGFSLALFVCMSMVLAIGLNFEQAKAAPNSTLYFSAVGVPATPLATYPSQVPAGTAFSVDAAINPGVNQVSGAELHVTFDPSKFSLTSIVAPSAPSPDCATNPKYSTVFTAANISNINGTASITMGICTSTPAVTIGTSTVATFNFVAKSTAPAGTYPISFDSSLTYATAVGEPGDALTAKNPINVTISTPDTTAPTINTFTVPATSTSLTVSGISVAATDDTAVTGYLLTEYPTAPSSSTSGWSSSAPTSYTFLSIGSKTLYAWAKDAAGNVSAPGTGQTVTISAPTYNVKGTLTGLVGTLKYQNNNNGEDITETNESGPMTFLSGLHTGDNYSLTITSEPDPQDCTITNGSGTMGTSDVTNVSIDCVNVYDLDGTVKGLKAGNTIVLQNEGVDDLTLPAASDSSDVPFSFDYSYDDLSPYAVTIAPSSQLNGQTCTVANSTGTFAGADVTNVTVTCAPADITPPVVTVVNIPSTSTSNVVPISTLTATDNIQVAAWMTVASTSSTTAPATPSKTDSNWQTSGITNTPSSGGTTATIANASATISSSGTWYIWAFTKDEAGNISQPLVTSQPVVVTLPPVISGSSPTNGSVLPIGTTQTTISFNTDKGATCKYDTRSGTAFASMPNSVTDSTLAHSFSVNNLANGGTYNYYVRCQDTSGNSDQNDSWIYFSVAPTIVTPTVPSIDSSNKDDNNSSSKNDHKPAPQRAIFNSRNNVTNGMVLLQRGKNFSKKTPLLLYFSKVGGGYYSPIKIVSSYSGTFLATYRVNKPKGLYNWYVVDTKNGRKSKLLHYRVTR